MNQTQIVSLGMSCLLLFGCGPRITYERVTDAYAPARQDALRFALQKASITLPAASNSPSTGAPTRQQNIKALPQTNSIQQNTATTSASPCANISSCLSGNPKPDVSSVEDAANIYDAVPKNDIIHKPLGRTTITGTNVPPSDVLYSKVSINYTDNTAAILGAAGTGAATGATVGGPLGLALGAAGGAIVGIGAAEAPSATQGENPLKQTWIDKTVCKNTKDSNGETEANYIAEVATKLPNNIQPIRLPVVIQPNDLPGPQDTGGDANMQCWHMLDNKGQNDGWFYRITFENAISKEDIASYIKPVADLPNEQDTSFPFSLCRQGAHLQITWWDALAGAVDPKTGNPKPAEAYDYKIDKIADSDFIQSVNTPYTGSINFNPVCGASPQGGGGPDLSSLWTALNTQAAAIIKAKSGTSTAGH